MQESRALGKTRGRVRVFKLAEVFQLVNDRQDRMNEQHEQAVVRSDLSLLPAVQEDHVARLQACVRGVKLIDQT